MADEVIRRDVVSLEFEVKSDPLEKVNKELDKISSVLKKAFGDNVFEDFEDGAEKAKDSVEELGDESEKTTKKTKKGLNEVIDKLGDLAKKAKGAAYNGLKKLASISFKGLVVGLGSATAAIGTLVVQSTKAFADFEQNIGGIQKLFGAGGQSLEEYAKSVGKSTDKAKGDYDKLIKAQDSVIKNSLNSSLLGLDANQYMETVTSFSASLISDLGGDTEKAASLADMAIKDMSDNANVFGNDMATVQQVYQGLAKDQYMLLDNLKLGYGGSKEGAKQLVKDAAKIDKSIKANDLSFSNMVKAINVIQGKMGVLGATEKEAAGTITGSLNASKAAWGNLLIAIGTGENIDLAFENLKTAATNFGKNIKPVVLRVLDGLGTVVQELAPVIAKELPKVAQSLIPPLISAAWDLTKGLMSALPSIIKAVVTSIVDIFGQQFPILGKIGKMFTDNAGGIAKGIIGIVVALKAFKGVKFITSLFGKKGGGGKKGGVLGSLTDSLKAIGKAKTKDVAKGLANLAIVLGGMSVITAVCAGIFAIINKFSNFTEMLQMVAILGAVGTVGAALAKFAGIVGAIPIPVVLTGLANMALVLGGMGVLITAFGALSKIPGLKTFIDSGGELLVKICEIIGEMAGSLVGGAIVGVTNGLPEVGRNLVGFVEGLQPMFSMIEGVDIKALGSFFNSIGGFFLKMAGGEVLAFLTGGIDFSGITDGLGQLSTGDGIKNFFAMAATITDEQLARGNAFFKCLGSVGGLPKTGGIFQWFTGDIDYTGLKNGLGHLSDPKVTTFFATVVTITEESMNTASKLFDCLGGVKSLPKSGGFVGWFNGKIDYKGVKNGLGHLSDEKVITFFAKIGALTPEMFTAADSFFNVLASVKGLPKKGGFKSWFGKGGIDYKGLKEGFGHLSSDKILNFFTKVGAIPQEAFASALGYFKVFAQIASMNVVQVAALPEIGLKLSEFIKNARGFFTGTQNLQGSFEAVGSLTNVLKPFLESVSGHAKGLDTLIETVKTLSKLPKLMKDVTTSIDTSMVDCMSNLVKKIGELPSKMGTALKDSGGALKEALVTIWKDAVKATATPANKLIAGANWMLTQFGSKKKVAEWKPYAKGTHGHTGGNALVNDGRGAELIEMPNGRTFIPQGKNVFIPNAPKGMKVLPAEQTAQLMGRTTPTYKYANGTGNIDIWNYMENHKGLIDAMKSRFVNYKGMVGAALHMGKGLVETVSGEMTGWVKKLYEEFIGKGWIFPSASRRITSRFGRRTAPKKGASTYHGGIDIGAAYGSPVFASRGGTVKRAGWAGGYGNLVELDHGMGWSSLYGHNSSLLVSAGQRVKQGQTIALVGSTGVSTGPHIHFTVKHNGVSIDPLSVLGKYANGGIATKPSIFGDDGAEMAIPLSKTRRKRAVSLWKRTGRMLGYTPENSVSGGYSAGATENNSYAPVFNFYVNGSVDDRATARKLKKQVKEAMYEVFESMGRRNPSLQTT